MALAGADKLGTTFVGVGAAAGTLPDGARGEADAAGVAVGMTGVAEPLEPVPPEPVEPEAEVDGASDCSNWEMEGTSLRSLNWASCPTNCEGSWGSRGS